MARSSHEVITLQLGHYANFVGTHWWNLQEASFVYDPTKLQVKEINHNVLFREGHNLMGEVTYTPRLVVLDLKGSLNTLKQEGNLYEVAESVDELNWSSDVTMHKRMSLPKNQFLKDLEREEMMLLGKKMVTEDDEEDEELKQEGSEKKTGGTISVDKTYYNLDNCVSVWSDYLRIHIHPRTVCLVEQYTHGNTSEPFDVFTQGLSVYRVEKVRHELEDRIHFFLEECDHLQGLHVLTDVHNGFGGLSSAFMQDLEDELDTKSMLVFGVSPPTFENMSRIQDVYRIMSMALTFEEVANHSSAFIPLSLASSYSLKKRPPLIFPNINYQPDLPYHTSAVLATALDTITMPHRLERPPSLLPHLTNSLTPSGRKILGIYHSLPFPLATDSSIVESLLDLGDSLPWLPLTPGCHSNSPCTAQSLVARGLPPGKLKGKPDPKHHHLLNSCNTFQEVMSLYLNEMCGCSLNAICSVQDTCKVTTPFPHIFSSNINKAGLISKQERPKEKDIESVPVMTSLQSTSAIEETLKSLLDDVKVINIKHFCKILNDEFEEDDYKESINNLTDLMDNYKAVT